MEEKIYIPVKRHSSNVLLNYCVYCFNQFKTECFDK